MPSVVSYPSITETTKTVFYEVLKDFFDGGTHDCSGLPIDFPDIDLSFSQQYRKNLTKPTVVLIGTDNIEQVEHKVRNPLNSRLPGVMLYADAVKGLTVAIPTLGKQLNQCNLEADRLWDALYAAFVGKKETFACRGICHIVPPVFPLEMVPDNTIVERKGLLRFQIQAAYSHFNTANTSAKRTRLWQSPLSQTLSLRVSSRRRRETV